MNKLQKKLLIIFLVMGIIIASGCTRKNKAVPKQQIEGKIKIYTTIYPLYDFAKKIAKDKADVEIMVPAGVEPHDFEPTPAQIARIYDSDVLLFLGEAMDPWAKRIEGQLRENGIAVVEVGEGFVKNNDPHIWLDPVLAKDMSCRIYEAIAEIDEKNRSYYQENFSGLEQKFDELDEIYKTALAKATKKDIVTAHAAFGYLAERYGFNQISIKGLSPQEEPSPKKMVELIEMCRDKTIKYIFFETLTSPKLSQTLAKEAGADTLVLNPIGSVSTEDLKAGEDYFSIMEKNLTNLIKALE